MASNAIAITLGSPKSGTISEFEVGSVVQKDGNIYIVGGIGEVRHAFNLKSGRRPHDADAGIFQAMANGSEITLKVGG